MGKLLWVLIRVLTSYRLNAMTSVLSFTDAPTDGIDNHRPLALIDSRDAHTLFCWSSITYEDMPNAGIGMNTDTICFTC